MAMSLDIQYYTASQFLDTHFDMCLHQNTAEDYVRWEIYDSSTLTPPICLIIVVHLSFIHAHGLPPWPGLTYVP